LRRTTLVLTVLLPVLRLGAQIAAPQPSRPAFEVATIKLARPDAAPRNQVLRVGADRISIPSMTLSALVYAAYGDGGFNTSMSVRGGPDWANRTAFSIEGLSSGAASTRQQRLMLQTLLEERFALKLRYAEETNDVLGLVPDRQDGTLGPKVKKWDGTCPAVIPALVFPAPRRPLEKEGPPSSEADDPGVTYCPSGYRIGGLRIDGATMFTVAEMLSLPPGRAALGGVTQDRTGLTDRYTLDLDYLFPQTTPAAAGVPEFGVASLADAIRDQWGLRVVRTKGPLKIVVVESAQAPAEN
jgi:uncharacterized protein (TIGR03435 family)